MDSNSNIYIFAPTFSITMTRRYFHIISFLLLALLTACEPPIDPKAQLRKAEQNIDTNPEAALWSLDSISAPSVSLRKSDYMKYAMLHVEAAYLCYKEVKNDTAIFEACRYYEKKNDLPQQAKVTLLSACVLEEQGQTDAAVDAYNKAFALASQNADSALMARAKHYLGNLNYNSGYYDEALQNYKTASIFYANNLSRKAQIYRTIGQTFALQHENDSALHYLEKGLEMARKTKNIAEENKLLNAMSIVYSEKGNFRQSLLLLRQSANVGVADNDSIRHHLNCANLFLGMNEMDSAGYYAEKLQGEVKNVEDGAEKTAIFSFLTKYEESIGNVDSAYHTHQLYTEILSSEYRRQLQQSVYEAQQKYDFEAQQNQYNKQLANRRRAILLLVIGLLVLAVAVAVAMFRNAQKNKALANVLKELLTFKHENNKMKTDFAEREKDWISSVAAYEDKLEQELKFKQLVMQQTDLLGKNYGEKSYMLDLEKTVFGNRSHWEKMMAVFDELYPGVRASLHEHYPQLSEMECNDFVLSIIGVSRNDEALLLDVSISVVDKMRSKVKKITGKN